MRSILTNVNNYNLDRIKIEADVIVTATVLGFIGTRYHQNQPCGFDREHPSPEDFRIWEVLNILAGAPQKGDEELEEANLKEDQKLRTIYKIQELWKKIRNTDERFYNIHKIEREIGTLEDDLSLNKLTINRYEQSRSDNQAALDKQYHNYLAKRLILDLEQKYPKQSLSDSLRKAIDSNQKDIEEASTFLNVLSAMSIVLNQTDKKIGDHLDDSQSPAWVPGALITGLKGGAGVDFRDRHRQIRSEKAKKKAEEIANEPELFDKIYQGRGAYTGMVDNPNDPQHSFLRPTRRVIDPNKRSDNRPEHSLRWHPGEEHAKKDKWGLITPKGDSDQTNLDSNRENGMGDFPAVQKPLLTQGGIVGYIHGMSSAICECIDKGPWCTPFEMAIGEKTTKMASCFACCTYMYAAGYPPSSMHLGRGESWVPPSLNTQKDGEKIVLDNIYGFKGIQNEFNREITSSVLTRWHREVYSYMTLGVEYLSTANNKQAKIRIGTKQRDVNIVDLNHGKEIANLQQKLNGIQKDKISQVGGNLFLDALTVHQSDWKRIKNTLLPLFDGLEGRVQDINKDFGIKDKNKKKFAEHQSYSNLPSASTFSTMASTDEPVLLNGMKVIFDESASVYPVSLTPND